MIPFGLRIQLFYDVYCIAIRKQLSKLPLKGKKGNFMVFTWLMSVAVKLCLRRMVFAQNTVLTTDMTLRTFYDCNAALFVTDHRSFESFFKKFSKPCYISGPVSWEYI